MRSTWDREFTSITFFLTRDYAACYDILHAMRKHMGGNMRPIWGEKKVEQRQIVEVASSG